MAFPYYSIYGLKHISIGNDCRIEHYCFLSTFDHYKKDTFNPEIKNEKQKNNISSYSKL